MKNSNVFRILSLAAALAACSTQGGTDGNPQGASPTPLALGGDFVAMKRSIDDAEAIKRSDTLKGSAAYANADKKTDFYLAIKKSALKERWFLSSYVKQVFPGSVGGFSLGTMVVKFKEQGGKLYLFNANDGIQYSDVVSPEVIVDAFPIVDNEAFKNTEGSDKYVLIDPAQGLNKFLLSPGVAQGDTADLQIDLSYVQNFKAIEGGVAYEEVFSGFGFADRTRISATLGLSLRKYHESPNYSPTNVPREGEFYFRADPSYVVNSGGRVTQPAIKWAFDEKKPVEWVMSPEIKEIAQEERFKGVDIEGAFKRGVTNWNSVLGFEALSARDATADESFARDDLNYLIIERDPAAGYAFANWRSNPNTGEILGASVFFSSMWFDYAEYLFLQDQTPTPDSNPGAGDQKVVNGKLAKIQERVAKKNEKKESRLSWKPAPAFKPCEYAPHAEATHKLAAQLASAPGLTAQQKVEKFLTHVVLHEIGHTLGLRHNFKGSLQPPSSSVMEYIDDYDAVNCDKPGSYDIAAIKYLYGQSTDLPSDKFCTDDSVGLDPDCVPYDVGADPLNEVYAPRYATVMSGEPMFQFFAFNDLANLFGYALQASKEATRNLAWDAMLAPIAVPATLAQGDTGEVKDFFLTLVLYSASGGPLTDHERASLLDQTKRALLNEDGFRTFEMRRVLVQALLDEHSNEAYGVLLSAKTTLQYQAAQPGLTELEKGLRDELVRRVDNAINTYF